MASWKERPRIWTWKSMALPARWRLHERNKVCDGDQRPNQSKSGALFWLAMLPVDLVFQPDAKDWKFPTAFSEELFVERY